MRRRYHPTLEFRFSKIARFFLKNYFFWGILACVPVLVYEGLHKFDLDPNVTMELIDSSAYWWINLLSLLRIVMLLNTFQSLVMLCNMLSETYYQYRITIENVKNIGLNILAAILMLHISACVWLTLYRDERCSCERETDKAIIHK